MAALGADWVAVIPFAFTRDDAPRVRFNDPGQYWGERTEGVRAIVRLAHRRGLHVMFKPQLWVARRGWAGDFAPEGQAGWKTWEDGYAAYIVHFARLAESLGVEMLCVGTEVDRTVRRRPAFWRDLIRQVRLVYDGPLTYAANRDDYEELGVWDDLDYLGVDAYFPLSEAGTPQAAELKSAWTPLIERLAAFSRRYGKPILFTEFGYRPVDGAAGPQWKLPPERGPDSPAPNPEGQAQAYEALFRAVRSRPWFAGGFAWKWRLGADGARGRSGMGYSPQGRSAEAVIRRWYVSGSTSRPEIVGLGPPSEAPREPPEGGSGWRSDSGSASDRR
ncbi:MAG: hypothetical protein ACE5HQ_03910 [Gemmatimonadota bacterium]